MTFVEARNLAKRLFGAEKIHRGKHRCFIIRDGMVIGDGLSWLEALRSAGEMQMAKNAMDEAEQKHVSEILGAFRTAHPDVPLEGQLTDAQLEAFDAFSLEYEKTHPNPVKRAPEKKQSVVPLINVSGGTYPKSVSSLVTLK